MKIAVLGTGMVGKTLAGKLNELGHEVFVGTRDVDATLAKKGQTQNGAPEFGAWHESHPGIKVVTLEEAGAASEIIMLATAGTAATEALGRAGEKNIAGKIVIDITNPLDFSGGMPPTLAVCNTDSIGEQLQRNYPEARIVKTLNTVNAHLMVDPAQLASAEHTLFVSGNDSDAKAQVQQLLKEWFGWKHIVDLGDITTARGTEMYLPLWIRLWGSLSTPMFSIKVVTQ